LSKNQPLVLHDLQFSLGVVHGAAIRQEKIQPGDLHPFFSKLSVYPYFFLCLVKLRKMKNV
jgi:hypothetical protein